MPQTLHCVILYSENFHRDDQKAAKKAGIETLVIANFHYTDKIKAVDIQYKAADNDKGLQILTFNWKRPKGMAHANVLRGSCGRRGSSPARAVRPKAEERRLTTPYSSVCVFGPGPLPPVRRGRWSISYSLYYLPHNLLWLTYPTSRRLEDDDRGRVM